MSQKFEKIYANSSDKFTKTVMLYAKSADTKLYLDSGTTTTVSMDGLMELLEQNLVMVNYNGAVYAPVSYKDNTTAIEVSIWDVYASSAPAAVKLTTTEPEE